MPRPRPGDPLGPLLGAALVQTRPLARLLGRVQPSRDQTALRARRARDLVVRSRKSGEERSVSLLYREPRHFFRPFRRSPRPRRRFALIWVRTAKLNEIVNKTRLHWSCVQIWTRGNECADVFRELFSSELAAYDTLGIVPRGRRGIGVAMLTSESKAPAM